MRRQSTIEARTWLLYSIWAKSKACNDGHEGTHYVMIMALKWALGISFDSEGNEIRRIDLRNDTQLQQGIATRLTDARVAAGLSQGQAARLAKMDKAMLVKLEDAKGHVLAVDLSRFCEIYQVDADWILGTRTEEDLSPELIAMTDKLKGTDRAKLLRVLASMPKESTD